MAITKPPFEPFRKIELLEIVSRNVWVTNERIYDTVRVNSKVSEKHINAMLKKYQKEHLIRQYKKPHIKHKNRPGRPQLKLFYTLTNIGKQRLEFLLKNHENIQNGQRKQ